MRPRLALGAALFISCGDVSNYARAVPDAAALGADGGAEVDAGLRCTPGKQFAEGPLVWQCTYNGNDATLRGDCRTVLPDGGFEYPDRYASSDFECTGHTKTLSGVGDFRCCAP